MMRITDTVKHLIIINVIFFAARQIPDIGDTVYVNMALFYPENPFFRIWQLISHMFMHGSFMHILFNMYALWAFGSPLEAMWGRNKFLFFYFAAGLGAGLLYTLVNYIQFESALNTLFESGLSENGVLNEIYNKNEFNSIALQTANDIFKSHAVGASGAIYGVLVAFAFKYPDVELMLMFIPVPIKAKFFIPAIVALDLFSGLTGFSIFGAFGGGGIAHFAHVGGALIGYLLMLYFQKTQFKRWN